MGGRYLLTGVQLGIFKALAKEAKAESVVDKIIEEQFVFDSSGDVDSDVKILRDMYEA